ncbi:cardiolipin synthase [Erysipelothrix aquatica]|uniref:cardiolipin synthase n=1 Tax=Erysipelothrix aquatica TaxID=2683714 RepID=UPI00202CC28C|nr:cardiolipin synthase [Erysipelothrix aquatica]
MKTLLRIITNKIFVVGIIVVAELWLLLYLVWNLSLNYATIYSILMFLAVLLVIYVINRNDNPVYRLAWTIVILVFPPIGAVLYLSFGGKKVPRKLREKITDAYSENSFLDLDYEVIMNNAEAKNPHWNRMLRYIVNTTNYPLYTNTKSVYLESGEVKFEAMKEALRSAKSYIFLEYFIIKDGLMWQSIYEILREKVAEGVDVRLMYDDWGCALFKDLQQQCDDAGIQAIAFNPLIAQLAIQMNNRNHRKICVVDGRVGIVGGMNLADEYINIGSKFGHWKDTAVMIEGDAVHSLTMMFLQFWRYYSERIEDPLDFQYTFPQLEENVGYVLPFGDAPTDDVDMGLDAHMYMINNARRYIYIQTPYLIIGYEMVMALKMAARSGVDVRIVVPHIPDKVVVNQVTKSNYQDLLEHGVRIFEYEPGFVHSKTVVVDDEIAMIGTTNMDYRSYYLHYECSILFMDSETVTKCYEDSIDTINNHCIEITLEEALKTPFIVRVFRSVVRVFSGLM